MEIEIIKFCFAKIDPVSQNMKTSHDIKFEILHPTVSHLFILFLSKCLYVRQEGFTVRTELDEATQATSSRYQASGMCH